MTTFNPNVTIAKARFTLENLNGWTKAQAKKLLISSTITKNSSEVDAFRQKYAISLVNKAEKALISAHITKIDNDEVFKPSQVVETWLETVDVVFQPEQIVVFHAEDEITYAPSSWIHPPESTKHGRIGFSQIFVVCNTLFKVEKGELKELVTAEALERMQFGNITSSSISLLAEGIKSISELYGFLTGVTQTLTALELQDKFYYLLQEMSADHYAMIHWMMCSTIFQEHFIFSEQSMVDTYPIPIKMKKGSRFTTCFKKVTLNTSFSSCIAAGLFEAFCWSSPLPITSAKPLITGFPLARVYLNVCRDFRSCDTKGLSAMTYGVQGCGNIHKETAVMQRMLSITIGMLHQNKEAAKYIVVTPPSLEMGKKLNRQLQVWSSHTYVEGFRILATKEEQLKYADESINYVTCVTDADIYLNFLALPVASVKSSSVRETLVEKVYNVANKEAIRHAVFTEAACDNFFLTDTQWKDLHPSKSEADKEPVLVDTTQVVVSSVIVSPVKQEGEEDEEEEDDCEELQPLVYALGSVHSLHAFVSTVPLYVASVKGYEAYQLEIVPLEPLTKQKFLDAFVFSNRSRNSFFLSPKYNYNPLLNVVRSDCSDDMEEVEEITLGVDESYSELEVTTKKGKDQDYEDAQREYQARRNQQPSQIINTLILPQAAPAPLVPVPTLAAALAAATGRPLQSTPVTVPPPSVTAVQSLQPTSVTAPSPSASSVVRKRAPKAKPKPVEDDDDDLMAQLETASASEL